MRLRRPKFTIQFVIIIALTLFILSAMWGACTSKEITVSFEAESEREIQYQVYYTQEKGERFSEPKSVKHLIPAGNSRVCITLPIARMNGFRLDFGSVPGNLKISSLILRGDREIEMRDYSEFRFVRIDECQASDNQLILNSKDTDPLIIYRVPFELHGHTKIDFLYLIFFAVTFFLLSYKLVQYLSLLKKKVGGGTCRHRYSVHNLFFCSVVYSDKPD